jgi:hypothetical protein
MHWPGLSHFVMVVLGTAIHEFLSASVTCPCKLVDGRTKSDHDGVFAIGIRERAR